MKPQGLAPLNKMQRQQVKNMLRSELEVKATIITTGAITVSTTGVLTKMTPIANGIGPAARIGDEAHLRRLRFRYSVTVGATGLLAAADQFNTVRIILFKYLIDDTTAPVTGGILTSTVTGNLTLAPYNLDQRDEYKIYYDKSVVVYNTPNWNGTAITWNHGVGGTVVSGEIEIPIKGKIQYNNGTVLGTGNIYCLLVSDSAFAPNPTCELVSAIEYTDA
jgi:hypothetical protein